MVRTQCLSGWTPIWPARGGDDNQIIVPGLYRGSSGFSCLLEFSIGCLDSFSLSPRVCVCMCVCVYVCVCVCVHTYVYIHAHTHFYTHIFPHTHMHKCIWGSLKNFESRIASELGGILEIICVVLFYGGKQLRPGRKMTYCWLNCRIAARRVAEPRSSASSCTSECHVMGINKSYHSAIR